MTVSMYDISVPAVINTLESMTAILDKAAAHCEAKKIDQLVLTSYRLTPDMFPLSRQIQIMTDGIKGMGARLTGTEIPSFPDTETTFDELKARIAKTIAFLKGLKPEQFKDSETRDISLKAGPTELKFKGLAYVTTFVLPNLYFHATAAYAILRHVGVNVGKMDYLGKIQ
jgi:hypothetical protein